MTETRRLGKYRLVRRLAVGGVAEVYLAVAEGLSGFEKRVVLKRLMPEHARDADLLSMFLDEARLMALLHHPHITEVYDIGAEEGEYFFALEHVDGCDLRELLDAQAGQPLPLAAALTVVVAVAEALEHAHGQRAEDGGLLGVVHRDVTPSNVLCGREGEVKLVDFGVAKWTAQRSRTEQGTIKGKFAYMSPEQCRAEPLDRRSDVFALGVILYELTTGSKPFCGESEFEVLSAIVAGRTAPPSSRRADYPAALEGAVQKALSTDRSQRFATAQEMRDALVGTAAELGLTLGAGEVAALVRTRQARQAPADRPLPALEPRPVTDRTATDLAMAATERALLSAPAGRGSARLAVGLSALALSSILAIGLTFALRGERVAARPAAETKPPPAEPRLAQTPSVPDRLADPPPVPPTGPAPSRSAAGATQDLPPPAPAPRSRPRPGPRPKAGPTEIGEPKEPSPPPAQAQKPSIRVWDPDSAILP
jgi:tRNA A-37 threonylcarbamoyl transferase component Bud32